MGHLLEPIAAYWYQQKTGNTVYDDTNLYQHADHPLRILTSASCERRICFLRSARTSVR
jgi:hypothetical protein